MDNYFGVIKISMPVGFKGEVLGQTFTTKIAKKDISLKFPLLSPNYDPEAFTPPNGDLFFPDLPFSEKINWGMIHEWPSNLFSINHLLCSFTVKNDDEIKMIYADFPRWKERLVKLHLINTSNYIQPKIEYAPVAERSEYRCNDLSIYKITNEHGLKYINNSAPHFFELHWFNNKESYSINKAKQLFTNAGSLKEISLAYELLITAYRAFERYDFTSTVVLAGTAVEQAILTRVRQEFSSAKLYKKEKKRHRMLANRFKWLTDLNIAIPVENYTKTIVDIRNKATHQGSRPSLDDTKICLENCKTIIEVFNPNILEN